VRLAYDVERRDRYGRTLAYVFRARDGLFLNESLVRGGFAEPLVVAPNVRHAGRLARAAVRARRERRGRWSACR
jgi:micrococcal nuclease